MFSVFGYNMNEGMSYEDNDLFVDEVQEEDELAVVEKRGRLTACGEKLLERATSLGLSLEQFLDFSD
jgi:hypothetical protein